MIYLNYKEFTEFHFGSNRTINAIYNGLKTIWQAVRSCFGAGYWKNDSAWSNNEGWKNN